jgi:DNA-binding CsgD family transcriptional regulator
MLENNLNETEKEIGVYLIDGLSTKEIANKLRMPASKVKMHIKNIRVLLNAENVYQVGALLYRLFGGAY